MQRRPANKLDLAFFVAPALTGLILFKPRLLRRAQNCGVSKGGGASPLVKGEVHYPAREVASFIDSGFRSDIYSRHISASAGATSPEETALRKWSEVEQHLSVMVNEMH